MHFIGLFPSLLIVAFCLLAITTMAGVIVACCGAFFKNPDRAVDIAVAIQRWGTLISVIVLAVGVVGTIITYA